jgi:hypothetical protein
MGLKLCLAELTQFLVKTVVAFIPASALNAIILNVAFLTELPKVLTILCIRFIFELGPFKPRRCPRASGVIATASFAVGSG